VKKDNIFTLTIYMASLIMFFRAKQSMTIACLRENLMSKPHLLYKFTEFVVIILNTMFTNYLRNRLCHNAIPTLKINIGNDENIQISMSFYKYLQ